MKRIGKLVILTTAEYESLTCRTESAEAAARDFAEELSRMRAKQEKEMQAAFYDGKFHAAGGYAHALKEARGKLQGTTATMCRALDLLAKWRPFVEALETYPNQYVEIGFDAGLHFPEEVTKKNGEKYVRTVPYAGRERTAPCKN